MDINKENRILEELFMAPLYEQDKPADVVAVCSFCGHKIRDYESYYMSDEKEIFACCDCKGDFLSEFLVRGA